MNKNTLIKIFSLLMIMAVIVSTVGCSIGNAEKKDGEAGFTGDSTRQKAFQRKKKKKA